jgi:hypothetical protein
MVHREYLEIKSFIFDSRLYKTLPGRQGFLTQGRFELITTIKYISCREAGLERPL